MKSIIEFFRFIKGPVYNDKDYKMAVKLGTVEYGSSMEESQDRIYSRIDI